MDMKRLFETYIFVLVLLAVTACTGGESTKTVPQSSDTLYTEQAVLDIYDTLPQRALQLLDSAVVVGTMPRYRADMLRAKVYCASCEAAQFDSAIVIGERLMLHDSVKANPRLQQDVLSNLQYACRLLLLRSDILCELISLSYKTARLCKLFIKLISLVSTVSQLRFTALFCFISAAAEKVISSAHKRPFKLLCLSRTYPCGIVRMLKGLCH